jgi:hypothetical protein
MNQVQAVASGQLGVRLVLFCCIALPTVVFAGEKQYPLEGTVTTVGTNQEITGGDPVYTHLHRTYTVKTPARIFVLEYPYWMDGFHIHSPSECGGS